MTSAKTQERLKERRKNPRLAVSIPVFLRGTDESGKEFLEFATVLNISASGVFLVTRRSLPGRARISLEIPVAPLPRGDIITESVRNLKAQMVRVIHHERCHLIGLRFLRPIRT